MDASFIPTKDLLLDYAHGRLSPEQMRFTIGELVSREIDVMEFKEKIDSLINKTIKAADEKPD